MSEIAISTNDNLEMKSLKKKTARKVWTPAPPSLILRNVILMQGNQIVSAHQN